MKQESKESFIKMCLEGKANTNKHYVYCILLNNQWVSKERLFELCSITSKEFNKAFKGLIHEGFIYHENEKAIAITDIDAVNILHEKQLFLEFQKDKERFIKKHSKRIPEHLLMQLKNI